MASVEAPPTIELPAPLARRGPVAMSIPTYDGSGEAVHPDVVVFPQDWNGFRFWGAMTPYRNSSIKLENPSLLGSADGQQWQVPATSLNPLLTTGRGHLSDPDMLFESQSRQLWMYYREVELSGAATGNKHVADHFWLTRSDDGRTWTEPREVFAERSGFVVSPAVVQDLDGSFRMFVVNAGTGGCNSTSARIEQRRSADGVSWESSKPVVFKQPGFLPWHLDVQYLPSRGEYWALVAAYPAGKGCHSSSLFLATSRDGAEWTTYPRPVLAPSEFDAFRTTVYRSTFAYEANDSLTIWYSGARQVKRGRKRSAAVFAWSMALTRTSGKALLAHVSDRTGAAKLDLAPATDVRTAGSGAPD